MKPLIVALTAVGMLLPLSAVPENAPVTRLSEPVASDTSSETFGSLLPASADVHRLADVMADAAGYVDRPVVVTARIGQVCQKKGCFFMARDGDAIVRVQFRDYAFFIPTDAGGKRAVFSGVLQREDVTEKEAQHYADDLGGDDKTVPEKGPAFTIVASAIQIFD